MSKKKFSQIRGISLVELLIGIVITSIMMTAMYTSYTVVNKTYSQVSERAKISRSSRDLVSMLMRDIRMSGFRYYAGTHTISKFASDTQSATGTECENYPDGMLRKLLDISRITDLGWKASINLKQGVKSLYKWYVNNLG